MITEFDKSGGAAYYKKRFAECVEEDDYEHAIDYLLKYHDDYDNADFHLACGMLYLQMSLDSDDNEIVCMAVRELFMHIRRFPDCECAYRDLLIALILRRDGAAFTECCKWIQQRGLNFRKIINELASTGILFPSSEEEYPPDFNELFDAEYGEIGTELCDCFDGYYEPDAEEIGVIFDGIMNTPTYDGDDKIIPFGGEMPVGQEAKRLFEVSPQIKKTSDDQHAQIDEPDGEDLSTEPFDDVPPDPNAIDEDDDFNDFINAYLYDNGDIVFNAQDDEDVPDHAEEDINDATAQILHAAEEAYSAGDFDGAIRALESVKRGDGRYYVTLCMRALIEMEKGAYDDAETSLKRAEAIKPTGALSGSLLCRLYEHENKTELIPSTLQKIDVKDYVNTPHLYKAFDMTVKYCDDDVAAELLRKYIKEFNIMEMRVVYAQIMYNMGERDFALDELYTLSRIFYDDINISMCYMMARMHPEKLEIGSEAPQTVLSLVVYNVMQTVLEGQIGDAELKDDKYMSGLEFFLTLEFSNKRKLLVKMFETVRAIASYEILKDKVRDTLVSPYVEPIVKAVILGELLAKSPGTPFLMEIAYCPIMPENFKILGKDCSRGYYIAYAFVLALCRDRLDKLNKLAAETVFPSEGVTDASIAYYLFKTATAGVPYAKDERLPLALGFASKAAAARDFKALSQLLKQ